MSKPKLETFVDRITAVMIDAGVEADQVKAKVAEICGVNEQTVEGWFSDPLWIPPAVHIAVLSVAFKSDCVWLITGKFSSKENVCDRHGGDVLSCTVSSETIQIKNGNASEVNITRGYKE